MSGTPSQTLALFEDDYLLRELGQVAHVPQVALTELVANAWDAGASKVRLLLPAEIGGTLTVTDDGHGMTPAQFKKRWMTLRYNREKHQGADVEFPAGRTAHPRRAYGRNGVGRHGLLCFADEYKVETWRDGVLTTFTVGAESGPSPFVLRSETSGQKTGSGTRLSVQIARKLPDADEILTVLATRFIHDPEFEIRVNGAQRSFDEIEGIVSEETLDLGGDRSATVIVIDSTRLNHSSVHQGIAFWVQRRLVGTPSWSVGQVASFDGRTRFARRYKVIVDTKGYDADVEQDWTAFRSTTQADNYVQDIKLSGAISGAPYICAWVVGQKVTAGVEMDKKLGNPEYGRVRATTFDTLVDTANKRLLKLRTVLADRYGNASMDSLLNRVISAQEQTCWTFRRNFADDDPK